MYSEMVFGLVRQIYSNGPSSALEHIENYLFGSAFTNFRNDFKPELNSDLKSDLIDEINREHVEERLLLDDSSRADYGRLFRMRDADHLLPPLVEATAVIVGTYLLLPKLQEVTSPDQRQPLLNWCDQLRNSIGQQLRELENLIGKILDANPDHQNITLMRNRSRELRKFFQKFDFEFFQNEQSNDSNRLRIHLTEESTGRPVENLEVVFNVTDGPVKLRAITHESDESATSLSLPTTERGYAAVEVLGHDGEENFGVTATYDEMNFLSFPKNLKLGQDYFQDHPDPDSIELQLIDYLSQSDSDSVESTSKNTEKIEEGTQEVTDRAVQVQTTMIRRHLRHLRDQDVRLIRIDDHHPYTPEILETLEDLREDGILEEIVLSSLPRGEHQPKEDQLCGTDLIYRQFIEGTEADNQGLEDLCRATHLQDLHIEEDSMALELSKLIGSRFSKVEMARELTEIKSRSDYENILRTTDWEEKITEYERGLAQVLPRVDLTLHRLTFTIPPEGQDYENEVDWDPLTFPLQYFTADEKTKQHLLRQLYAEDSNNTVTILAALSPFCDPDEGEPQINVASAQNYLSDLYDFDYLFYAYGSMLLSTRRVNEEGFDIDLSKLVSEIGSPSDGGHPGAATGSPASNPNFPVDRFEDVKDKNFTEYLFYISDIVKEHTGLNLHSVEEVYPSQFETGVRSALRELDNKVYHLDLRGDAGIANVIVADSIYTNDNQGDVTVPLACSHLQRAFSNADYVFYTVSLSNLVLRNLSDPRNILNLHDVARTLGTYRDGGEPRAASCKPRFHPEFPEERIPYVNQNTLEDYVNYLGNKLSTKYNFSECDVRKAQPSESVL